MSVAVTEKVLVPLVVGVPESVPPVAREIPAGSTPLVTVQVYGAVPPEAVNDVLYAMASRPVGNVAGETVIDGQTGVSVYIREPKHESESAAKTVNVAAVVEIGVPEITPAALSDRPAGRLPDVMLKP